MSVLFAGHPFASIGKGEEIRSAFSAYRSLDTDCAVFDIYRYAKRIDPHHLALLSPAEVQTLDADVRVFHINGDEVEPVLRSLERRGLDFRGGRNVVVPAWELPHYPAVWCDGLRRFDAVWAISRFMQESLARSGIASHHVGQAAEVPRRPFLPRRRFGIRASSFVFLTLLDLSSYSDRKNPEGVLAMYRRLRERHPFADMQLVVKVKNGDQDAKDWIAETLGDGGVDVVFVDRPLSTHETHSLIAAADCFVSLHRAEGFGRGAAEAMWLGRPSIATAWSGNMDYMDPDYAGAVRYALVDVPEGSYPHHEGQVWAEPDIDHALAIAERYLTDGAVLRRAAETGQEAVRRTCSHRAVGLRMLESVRALTTEMAAS